MNTLTNTGYGTQNESSRGVSIGVLFAMPKSGTFIMDNSIYKRWMCIKQRCYNDNISIFEYYGGRGIKMCDEWLKDFKAFHDYVIALPGALNTGLSLDRIDNDGNYEPDNLRWTDMHTQTVNRRLMKNNTTGYMGVSRHYDKYRVSISVYGKRIALGRFSTIEDAVNARNQYILDNNLTEYKIQERGSI